MFRRGVPETLLLVLVLLLAGSAGVFGQTSAAAVSEAGRDSVPKQVSNSAAVKAKADALRAAVRDFTHFAKELTDLDRLVQTEFVPVRLESSYDRTGGNNDGFNPERLKDNVYTIADLKGPGVITRFYSAKPLGRLRVFIDGQPKPLIDMPSEEFFSGRTYPFVRPVTSPGGGANYSYFPIPYAKSILIQTTPIGPPTDFSYGFYYQVTHYTFPEGTRVRSLQLPLSSQEKKVWDGVLRTWGNWGQDPRPSRSGRSTNEGRSVIEPGHTALLADINGPASVEALHLRMESEDPNLLRTTLLKMRWDSEPSDAVDAPVGDFFGNGFDRIPYRSLPMGLTKDGWYYSYFAMPFGKRGRIAVVNESPSAPLTVQYRIVSRKLSALPPATGYFHAKWRREDVAAVNLQGRNTTGDQNYRVLDAHGQGRFIGLNLNVFNRGLFWWGEGDPMIFVDGDSWPPRYHGTGTEEFFNDAYGFHRHVRAVGADPAAQEQNVGAVSGVISPGLAEPASCYGGNAVFAFQFTDSIPFRERIRVTFEHGTANNRAGDYASTAYWYASPGASDFFEMRPVAERLTVLPQRWPEMRRELMVRSLPNVQRRLATLAEEIRKKPTDASNYRARLDSVWGPLMVPGEDELPNEDRARLQAHFMAAYGKTPQEQWKAIDEVLLELAARLVPAGSPK
jgi:hypothetical protein